MLDTIVDAAQEHGLSTVLMYVGTWDRVVREMFIEPPEGLFIYRGVLFACLVGGPAYGWEVVA